MKYSETDLTEATKIISYLRSIRIYAVTILFSSLLYLGLKIINHTAGTELYLLYCFTGIIIVGSLSALIRLNHKTASIYGLSYILSGVAYSFSIFYYRGETQGFFTTIGFIAGLIIIRHGVSVAFGNRSQEAFSRVNQKKVSFIINLLVSLKQSLPNEKDVIHCTYTDDKGKKKILKIKLLDDVICFLLSVQSAPIFFDRNNVFISEIENKLNFLTVSIIVDNHDWLEAEMKLDDFKKYEAWKDL
ncbi:MAG: hypothetical protein L6290_03255 [Thermodesulfovibrionales bacterium]|nr:hypothetical protein [Thermodesulfovibrionales bacterium]